MNTLRSLWVKRGVRGCKDIKKVLQPSVNPIIYVIVRIKTPDEDRSISKITK
jgi:hypothetical protein